MLRHRKQIFFLRNLFTTSQDSIINTANLAQSIDTLHTTNASGIAFLLRQCTCARSLTQGRRVHEFLKSSRLKSNTFLCNLLIQMYGSCGSLQDCRQVFDELAHKNVFSWNLMIVAYACNAHLVDAIQLFNEMPLRDEVSWVTMIAAFASDCYLEKAIAIFAKTPVWSIVCWNAMLSVYAQNDRLVEMRKTFDQMTARDLISWTTVVVAYAREGYLDQMWDMFTKIPLSNSVSWTCMITAYAKDGYLEVSSELFDAMPQKNQIAWNALIQGHVYSEHMEDAWNVFERIPCRDEVSWNTILAAYIQCGSVDRARMVFDALPCRNSQHWTSLIVAYAKQEEHGEDAMNMFLCMDVEGFRAEMITYMNLLYVCGELEDAIRGKMIHDCMAEDEDVSCGLVATALMKMYARCGLVDQTRLIFNSVMRKSDVVCWTCMLSAYAQNGLVEEARLTFERMPARDMVAWSATIGAYVQAQRSEEAMWMFQRMQVEGCKPEKVTFVNILDACSSLRQARSIHEQVVECGLDVDVVVASGVLNMYGRCGCVDAAKRVFEKLPASHHNVISWTAWIRALIQNNKVDAALEVFKIMDLEGVSPDAVTYSTIMDACLWNSCSSTSALITQIKLSLGDSNKGNVSASVGNAVMDMYGKCGSLKDALTTFKMMACRRNILSWNTIISAYANHGYSNQALEMFKKMILDGNDPSDVSFLVALCACSHGGMLDDGVNQFASMVGDYGIIPSMEHYVCIVDLLARAGRLHQVEDLVNSMPFEPNAVALLTFLASCQCHGDVNRGVNAALEIWTADLASNAAPYVLLANIIRQQNPIEYEMMR